MTSKASGWHLVASAISKRNERKGYVDPKLGKNDGELGAVAAMDDDVEAHLSEGVGKSLADAVQGARHYSPRWLGPFRMQIAGELGRPKVDDECVGGEKKDHGNSKDANVGKESGGA